MSAKKKFKVRPVGDDAPDLVSRGEYVWSETGVRYPRVSALLDVLGKPALVGWAAKVTAEAAVHTYDKWKHLDDAEAIDFLKQARWKSSGDKADKGTEIHGMLPYLVGVEDVPAAVEEYENDVIDGVYDIDEDNLDKLISALAWLKEHCSKMLHQEVTVFKEGDEMSSSWAGTADLICETKHWGTVIADLKTGKSVFRETGLQMAAYAIADWMSIYDSETGLYTKGEIPEVDNFVVVHALKTQANSFVIPWRGDDYADQNRDRLTKCIQGCANILSFVQVDPWFSRKVVTKA